MTAPGPVRSDEFERLTATYRAELLAHCYRMLGSIHDAEDAVQDTYLRAWRFYEGFDQRAPIRSWLYRIATNVCFTALERRGRRPLPSDLHAAHEDARGPLAEPRPDVPWLGPAPDAAFIGADPAGVVMAHEDVRLAFVAALQHLPARQRSVLLLRDVLAMTSHEVAAAIGTTTDAVNGMLKRARKQIAADALERDNVAEPDEPTERALVARFVAAFESADVVGLVELLSDDAIFEMPPLPKWFAGIDTIRQFVATHVLHSGNSWRGIPTRANGQPAVATYLRDDDIGPHRAHGITALTVRGMQISRMVSFLDTGLFSAFGLPPAYPGEA
jgi:RNA polymerase sigma-70 factor (ECF subfamily)